MKRYEESWIDSLSKSYKDKVPQISKKEDFNKLEQDLRAQRKEMRKLQAYMKRQEQEKEQGKEQKSDEEKTEEEKAEEEKLNKEIEKYLEEVLSNEYLVRGALLHCSFGSHERKLNILKDHGVYIEQKPIAHKLDKVEFENIMSFGVCNSGSKYLKTEKVLLEKEITDENGKVKKENVKGKACLPYIIKEWLDTKKNVHIVDNGDKDASDKQKDGNDKSKGYEILTMNSFLVCRHGGLIEPIDSGQELIYENEKEMKLKSEEGLEETTFLEMVSNLGPFATFIVVNGEAIKVAKKELDGNYNIIKIISENKDDILKKTKENFGDKLKKHNEGFLSATFAIEKKDLNKLKILDNTFKKIGYVSIGYDTLEGIKENIEKGETRISEYISDGVIEVSKGFGNIAIESICTNVGMALGSAIPIPGVGTAIGGVLGFAVGYVGSQLSEIVFDKFGDWIDKQI